MAKDFKLIHAKEMNEGQGAKVKRAFPNHELSKYDPFALFDEFFVEPPASFPMHSHYGFEAITYMLDGAFKHEDTSGVSGRIEEGEAQHMVTGRGLQHSEAPGNDGLNHGLQIWIKLPEDSEDVEPDYMKVEEKDMPVVNRNGKKIKTIVGEGSPIDLRTVVELYHIFLNNGLEYSQEIKAGKNSFIYIISGSGVLQNGQELGSSDIVILEEGEIVLEAKNDLEFIFGVGQPLHEPIILGKNIS